MCTKDAFTIGQILGEVGRSSLESDTAERRLWERARVDANICAQSGNGNETGPYIGTASVARDMMRVAEALDEDGMLRYWGEFCVRYPDKNSATRPDRATKGSHTAQHWEPRWLPCSLIKSTGW